MSKGNTIRRGRHDAKSRYMLLLNDVAQNKAMSYEALGLLTYLLSRPEDWEVRVADLMREGCKRGRVYTLLDELVKAGHCRPAKRYQDKKGHWQWTPYEIYEEPQPNLENPDTVLPDTVIRYPVKRDTLHSTESQSTEKDIAAIAAAPPKPKKERARNPMFDAIAAVFGYTDEKKPTKSEAGLIGKAAAELAEAGYTPDQIPHIYTYCIQQGYKGFTARALAAHAGNWKRSQGGGRGVNPLAGLEEVC